VAEQDNPAGATARLEQALERIARLAREPHHAAEPGPDMGQITARLDGLITELRAALAQSSGAGQ